METGLGIRFFRTKFSVENDDVTEKAHTTYNAWVGKMTKKFSGKGNRINSTLQRGMYWNQAEQKAQLERDLVISDPTTKNESSI